MSTYKSHFGLHETPFGITPDTSFFFSFGSHLEALNTLLVAAQNGEGFIKITGEVGTGKTLLCRQFLKMLGDDFVSAYIPNPFLEPRTLLLVLADDLGIPQEKDSEQHEVLKAINLHLLNLAKQGKRVLVCIDEAQALPIETLEAIRLLSNLETEKRKLLQIVLFGQPELDKRLARNDIRQLAQRISFHYRLRSLNWEETSFYIQHRLRVAGFSQIRLFSRSAIFVLWLASAGVPRMLNILANKAMMLSYGEGRAGVGARQVIAAIRDTEAAPGWKRISSTLALFGLAFVVGASLLFGFNWKFGV
ncbi:MSHA biogenesis protein MshM [Undibacterium macrobrachii]|jgi:MSHA biogenesis protein MshM|uniref:MSHA biogenesis protein MshM n=2 Tax=Undibacterium macrobrachii TaxID=1119058 RepID=A0ABQ2X7G6_9BURK|nr:MSHA biogenesis protein MshM [Undibacterium macrobrachii]